jgi:hypothetical protein
MEIINKKLSLEEFKGYVRNYNFSEIQPDKLVLHHTWRPTQNTWNGEHSIMGLKRYYEGKNWPAGPHLFIAEDGIWLFSPMDRDGIHAGELNRNSIGIEVVGDYDDGVWEGSTKENALGAIKVLMEKLNLSQDAIYFHSDVSDKTCPGQAITRDWLKKELEIQPMEANHHIRKSDRMAGIENFSPKPQTVGDLQALISPPDEEELMIPLSAVEAVTFVKTYELFKIEKEADIKEAKKFYRFYKLLRSKEV